MPQTRPWVLGAAVGGDTHTGTADPKRQGAFPPESVRGSQGECWGHGVGRRAPSVLLFEGLWGSPGALPARYENFIHSDDTELIREHRKPSTLGEQTFRHQAPS